MTSRCWRSSSRATSASGVVDLGGRAQARDRLAQQARHLHLADTDDRADLGLRHVLLEAQAQHLALALADRAEQAVERGGVIRAARLERLEHALLADLGGRR